MGCLGNALSPIMYTENLVREFYAKLTAGIKDPQVHIWCGLCEGDYITLTLANIVEFLSCPHYAEIKGTVLDEDVDWDHVAQVLTDDVVSA